MTILKLLIFCLILLPPEGSGERVKNLMYENIKSTSGCYRRLNSTHQIGCSSKNGGSTGIIHVCKTHKDLTFILEEGKGKTYIPLLPAKLFNVDTLNEMIESKRVSGVMLYIHNVTLESLGHFTHERQCPNPYTSLNGSCKNDSEWNPYGTGLLYADIPFPIFYTDDEQEIIKMTACFEQYNNFSFERQAERSLCSLEMKSFMPATTNTVTCQRRSHVISSTVTFCDPLGDKNLWVSLYPLVDGPNKNEMKPVVDNKYIVIAAKLDTTSMFDKMPGANSPATGIVTLLMVAKYLKDILTINMLREAKTNVLFILFNGESYDYIGSQRILYDMLKGDFPMKNSDVLPKIHPDNVSLFIELSQLGNSKENQLFVHYWNESKEIRSFYKKLEKNGQPHLYFQNVSGTNGLPPASLHTFLKSDPSFPGLIIADHESSYSNHFYNSLFDNSTNIAYRYYDTLLPEYIPKNSFQQFIANMSEAIGKSVFEEITKKKYTGNASSDVVLADELLYCYLENPNCRVLTATQQDVILDDRPLNFYIGINGVSNFARTVTTLALGWLTGDVIGKSNGNCTNIPKNHVFQYYNMSSSIYELDSTVCYRLSIHTTDAVSPAFIIPDYDWASGEFSSWTESRWYEMSARLFLKPSAAHEQITIVLGLLSLVFSSSVVYFVKSKSHLLFTPIASAEGLPNC
ncbi:unnamed protein product [Phaedon cochleariae]|uniref:Nicastrin n=1 Tax=Phaedon cochleariae TaxID=80249 RepID=A0A9P0D9U9_PHACE|nr:unnamed protein product [Phaedon cochleariae]